MPTLRVIDGPHKGEEFVFTNDRVLAGRDLNNAIRLPDGLVSRHHAEIVRDGDNYVVCDLQSTNGTFVNDTLIPGATTLKDGDIIRMADVVIQFHETPNPNDDSASEVVGLKTPIFKQLHIPDLPAVPAEETPESVVAIEEAKPVTAIEEAPPPPKQKPGFFGRLLRRKPKSPAPPPEPVTESKPVLFKSEPPAPVEVPEPVPAPPPPAPKPVILKTEPVAPPEPKVKKPIVPSKPRLYTKAYPGPAAARPKPVEEDVVFMEAPRRKLAPFLITTIAGVMVLIAGYSLDANALRFLGLLLMIVGLLCLFHDWTPLPPKTKAQ